MEVIAVVMILAVMVVAWAQERRLTADRDAWKACADGLAAVVRSQPMTFGECGRSSVAMVHQDGVTTRGASVQAARALAIYNALLEPEDGR